MAITNVYENVGVSLKTNLKKLFKTREMFHVIDY